MKDQQISQTVKMTESTKLITLKNHGLMSLSIWDFPGDDNYLQDINNLISKEAQMCVLCYAIDSRQSFEYLQKCYERLEHTQIPIIIIGCKSDLGQNRAVSVSDVNKFQNLMPNCRSKLTAVAEISAHDEDITNINQLFDDIGTSIIEQGLYTTTQ